MITGYCVKCKEKGKEMKTPRIEMTVKGGFMAKGFCPACNTKMCAMMSKINAEAAITAGEAEKAY